jgi:hypothetical protein
LLVPDPSYRPNPDRAIYVHGLIDQQLVDRVTPRIVLLQSRSREPITVYIDSRGGAVTHTEILRRLLNAPNQDGVGPCRIITVVTSRAASSAADLLSAGDYALAYPESTVLYHGVRTSLDDPLTAELTSFLTENLKLSNDRHAMALVRQSEWRFMFRFVSMRPRFEEFRERNKPRTLSDLDCFVGLISENLSEKAKRVVAQAEIRYGRYSALLDRVLKAASRKKQFALDRRAAEVEGVIIKAIIDFEVSSNKKNQAWTFRDGGLTRLNDDFFLLQEYISSSQSAQFKSLCERWGSFILTKADEEEIEKVPEPDRAEKKLEKVRPQFQPLWSFIVALCHALQEGENELTATDVFWLGLIDEVIGANDLPSLRMVREFTPDPEPAQIEAPPANAGAARA